MKASFLLLFLPPSSCLAVVLGSFFSYFPHVGGGESGQAGTLFLSDARLVRFPSSFLSFFLTFFHSLTLPSLWLLWQALFEFSPHGSGRKSMPICVFSCSTLDWWRLEEIKTDEQNSETLSKSTDYRQNIYQTLHLFAEIMEEQLNEKCSLDSVLFFFPVCPRCLFLASDGRSEGKLIVENGDAGIKDYYQRIQPGIHSDQHSVTISLHSVLLSSLTSNGESQTCYWLPSHCFIVSVSWLRLLTCLIVSRWIVK